ncbi:MAG: PAS domain S-box protein, partial [Desulfuromonadales bacterium]|nr:PAS domain S-box protein [Desulfuromonadales bacterium]
MIGVLWTIVIASFTFHETRNSRDEIFKIASVEAQGSINKDIVYRRWAASHGGVYVPISKETPPNKDLAHLPERDLETPSGRQLTLVNPAYMTRQVYDLSVVQNGLKGHLTSLKPLRPENKADAWETEALQSFEKGIKSVKSIEQMNGKDFLRVMIPFPVETACLKCHASQDYQVGDIRGGISVSVPLDPYYSIYLSNLPKKIAHDSFIWVLGVCALLFIRRKTIKSAEKLKESQERFKVLHDASSGGIIIHDQGLILECNKGLSDITGFTHEELVGMDGLKLIAPDSLELVLRNIKSGYDQKYEVEGVRKDGSLYHLAIKGGNVLYQGHEARVIEFRDITEDVLLKRELKKTARELNERVKELNCLHGISTLSLEENLSIEEFMQRTVNLITPSLYYPESTCAKIEYFEQTFTTSNFKETDWVLSSEISVSGKIAGKISVYSLEEKPELDEGPFLKEERALLEGISERLGHTIERKASKDSLLEASNIINRSPSVAFLWENKEGWPVAFVSNNVDKLYGYSALEFMNGTVTYNALIHSDDIERVTDEVVTNIERKDSQVLVHEPYRIITKNGEIKWVEDTTYIRRNSQGMITHYEGIVVDVTERRKLYEERIRTSQLASLGELAAGMAHEINNPITGVINYAQLLLNKQPEEDSERDILNRIIKEGGRVATIVHNLLDFANKDSQGKALLRIEDFIHEPLQMIQQQLYRDGISLDVDIADDLPVILGNTQKLGQVILSLISNARYALNKKYRGEHPDKKMRISA